MGSRVIGIIGVGAAAVMVIAGCSGGTGTTTSSPSTSPESSASASGAPTASADTFTVKVGDWDLVLSNATEPPADWPTDIPAPSEGVVQATGTGEPIETTSDHPVKAVEYMAPGEVDAVTKAQKKDMIANGWEDYGTSRGITIFVKGNDSARISVKPNASTGGVTVYQWV
ncbi:MAG: hypothetical protein V9E98_15860 [Candidatus Nanopelagicales bacterium]